MSLDRRRRSQRPLWRHRVLRDVSLHVEPGEIVTIVGPNGSGKTSLLRAIVGAVAPTSGRSPGQTRPRHRLRAAAAAYRPDAADHGRALPAPAGRQVTGQACAARARGRRRADLAGQQMSELSGGQMQRVMLARALVNRPTCCCSTNRHSRARPAGLGRLLRADRRGAARHRLRRPDDQPRAARGDGASDRVICLNGHVCCEGTPEHVSSAPEYRALFGTGTHGALALYRHEHDHTDA
jgi:zinc transport system ATP-binding protein